MLPAGHIIVSTILAAVLHKRLKVNFVPLAFAMILVNLVDIDHLVTYNLDNGFVSSFSVHILHRYWAFLCLITCFIAIILSDWQNMILGIFLALLAHFCCDLFADFLHYDFIYLGISELVLLAIFGIIGKTKLMKEEKSFKILLFLVLMTLIIDGILALMYFHLKIKPDASIVFYLVATLMTLFSAFAFYFVFRRKGVKRS
jgi:hypothetical protein